MNTALHIRKMLVLLTIACSLMLFAVAGPAAAAQRSPQTRPAGHVTKQAQHPRIVAYADGTLTHHAKKRRHVVAYAD
jgi:hypothetical protein